MRRRRGVTRITSKNQVTLPVATLRDAGLVAGDEVRVSVESTGRIVVARADDPFMTAASALDGCWPEGVLTFLGGLRSEWR